MKEELQKRIDRAIAYGIVTQDEIDVRISDSASNLLNGAEKRISDDYLSDKIEAALEDIFPDNYIHIASWAHLTVRTSKPKQLHGIRTVLRKVLGAWEDSISSMQVYGDIVEVKYEQKNHLYGEPIIIEVNYKLANLPEGILKPGCKIVETTSTNRYVSCNV